MLPCGVSGFFASSQRSFAFVRRPVALEVTLYRRRHAAGKRESCVLSSAKVNTLFRIIARLRNKLFWFFEIVERLVKTCGLFLEAPLVSQRIPLFFGESSPRCFARSHRAHFLTRRDTSVRTHPRASRTQRVRISCLHPSPSPLTRCYLWVYGWSFWTF